MSVLPPPVRFSPCVTAILVVVGVLLLPATVALADSLRRQPRQESEQAWGEFAGRFPGARVHWGMKTGRPQVVAGLRIPQEGREDVAGTCKRAISENAELFGATRGEIEGGFPRLVFYRDYTGGGDYPIRIVTFHQYHGPFLIGESALNFEVAPDGTIGNIVGEYLPPLDLPTEVNIDQSEAEEIAAAALSEREIERRSQETTTVVRHYLRSGGFRLVHVVMSRTNAGIWYTDVDALTAEVVSQEEEEPDPSLETAVGRVYLNETAYDINYPSPSGTGEALYQIEVIYDLLGMPDSYTSGYYFKLYNEDTLDNGLIYLDDSNQVLAGNPPLAYYNYAPGANYCNYYPLETRRRINVANTYYWLWATALYYDVTWGLGPAKDGPLIVVVNHDWDRAHESYGCLDDRGGYSCFKAGGTGDDHDIMLAGVEHRDNPTLLLHIRHSDDCDDYDWTVHQGTRTTTAIHEYTHYAVATLAGHSFSGGRETCVDERQQIKEGIAMYMAASLWLGGSGTSNPWSGFIDNQLKIRSREYFATYPCTMEVCGSGEEVSERYRGARALTQAMWDLRTGWEANYSSCYPGAPGTWVDPLSQVVVDSLYFGAMVMFTGAQQYITQSMVATVILSRANLFMLYLWMTPGEVIDAVNAITSHGLGYNCAHWDPENTGCPDECGSGEYAPCDLNLGCVECQ